MINEISVRTNLRIHGKIGYEVWVIFSHFCQAIDKEGSSKVEILIPQVKALFGISRATFYRLPKERKQCDPLAVDKKKGSASEAKANEVKPITVHSYYLVKLYEKSFR